MGEAKRRAAAPPWAKTTANQMVRKISAQFAALPPAPMNGAKSIDLSPTDYTNFVELARPHLVQTYDGITFEGVGIRKDPLLIDGLMTGRDCHGKLVWSNNPALAEAIGISATAPVPSPDAGEADRGL